MKIKVRAVSARRRAAATTVRPRTRATGNGSSNAPPRVAPPAEQIEQSLREILAAVESGRRPQDVMRADTVEIPGPGVYHPADVKATRRGLG